MHTLFVLKNGSPPYWPDSDDEIISTVILGMYVVGKGSWKDRDVGQFLVGKFFPSSSLYMAHVTWEIVKLEYF